MGQWGGSGGWRWPACLPASCAQLVSKTTRPPLINPPPPSPPQHPPEAAVAAVLLSWVGAALLDGLGLVAPVVGGKVWWHLHL